jgi:hypothetical protein
VRSPRLVEFWRVYGFPIAVGVGAAIVASALALVTFHLAGCL